MKFDSTLAEFQQLDFPKELLDFQELKIIQDPHESCGSNSSDSQSGIIIQDKFDLEPKQDPQESCEVTRSESPFEIIIQDQNENSSAQTVEAQSESEIWDLLDNEFKNKLEILSSMGFLNQKLNYELLLRFQNVDAVLEQLLN